MAKLYSDPIAVLNKDIDLKWATQIHARTLQSYFDYFYTGQDVKVFIEGAESPDNMNNMPIMNFAYSVEQRKVPVYGHASTTYDAVMRGNRLVTGAFTIATTKANYMTDMLSWAASARFEMYKDGTQIAPLKQDLVNMERYWTINTDNALSPGGYKNIFSSHPPFNFIIVIGLQPDSGSIIGFQDGMDCDSVAAMYPIDAVLSQDINERLLDSDPEGENRRVIQNVELVKLDQNFSVDGEVLAETYSFFARDEFPLT